MRFDKGSLGLLVQLNVENGREDIVPSGQKHKKPRIFLPLCAVGRLVYPLLSLRLSRKHAHTACLVQPIVQLRIVLLFQRVEISRFHSLGLVHLHHRAQTHPFLRPQKNVVAIKRATRGHSCINNIQLSPGTAELSSLEIVLTKAALLLSLS